MKKNAPNVTMIACYNGPAETKFRGVTFSNLPQMGDDELGLMYKLPNVIISLDQYGSLHYGWPGHTIDNPPVMGPVTYNEHRAFALSPDELCEQIILPFQKMISEIRNEKVRIDLGELDFDEDIHGPKIRTRLVKECYEWIGEHPEIIGSVIFYELTDMAGLGLLRQKEYGNLDTLIPSQPLLGTYKNIMRWDEFHPHIENIGSIEKNVENVELLWHSAIDAEGIEMILHTTAEAIDFKSAYWCRIIFLDADDKETYVHTDSLRVNIPEGTKKIRIFALPPDGRNNCDDGYRIKIPIPLVY